MRIAFLLITLLLLVSCQKDKLKLQEGSLLIGDHNWTYSKEIVYTSGPNPDPEMVDVSETQDRYGLRVKKNGKAWLFKNGKVEMTGYIKEIPAYEGVKNVIQEKNGDRVFELAIYKNEIAVIGYPIENYYNFYIK